MSILSRSVINMCSSDSWDSQTTKRGALSPFNFVVSPKESKTAAVSDPKKNREVHSSNKLGSSIFASYFKRSEMKLRLGFLNRRSTETALSVRPQPQEAQKWAQSFADLMASKYGASLYRAFLQREFSDENFDFWMACEDFKKSRSQKLSAKAQKIYNEFIAVQAPREVNLDPETRLETLAGLQTPVPDRNAFERAQRRVQGLLERDSYVRFLQSDLFLELIHPERYQECNDASR